MYNTCSGYSFNAKSSSYDTASTRRTIKKGEKPAGPYDDQVAFMTDAGKLAKNLLSEGYTAMKIWPFDMWATGSYGCDITDEGIERGMDAFRKIRDAVGGKMQIMCEMHSIWKLPAALKICRALEEVGVLLVKRSTFL